MSSSSRYTFCSKTQLPIQMSPFLSLYRTEKQYKSIQKLWTLNTHVLLATSAIHSELLIILGKCFHLSVLHPKSIDNKYPMSSTSPRLFSRSNWLCQSIIKRHETSTRCDNPHDQNQCKAIIYMHITLQPPIWNDVKW